MVSSFLSSSGGNAQGESRALIGQRVSSKSPSRVWDRDEGVAGRNCRELCYPDERSFYTKKLEPNWVNHQTCLRLLELAGAYQKHEYRVVPSETKRRCCPLWSATGRLTTDWCSLWTECTCRLHPPGGNEYISLRYYINYLQQFFKYERQSWSKFHGHGHWFFSTMFRLLQTTTLSGYKFNHCYDSWR